MKKDTIMYMYVTVYMKFQTRLLARIWEIAIQNVLQSLLKWTIYMTTYVKYKQLFSLLSGLIHRMPGCQSAG